MLLTPIKNTFFILLNLKNKLSIIILFLILANNSSAIEVSKKYKEWPNEAVDFLNQLPNQEISLKFVVAKAVADSDVFQMHKSEYFRGSANHLATISIEDFKILSGLSYTDNQNEPVVPNFMSTSSKGWNAQLGFEKFLNTGTTLTGGITHSSQKLGFTSIPSLEYKESRLNLGLNQNLLSDFGGKSYKNLKKSSLKASKANEFLVLSKIEGSILETISFYYNAWLKQQILKNLKSSLSRRQTLNSILKKQNQKGLIENSDALQIEGLVLNNQAELETNRQELQSMWEQLVIQLKLPVTFLNVPADQIPLTLDSPEINATKSCEKLNFDDIQKLSSSFLQAENLIEAAEKRYQSILPKLNPDLRLQANLSANGIDSEASETFKEVGDLSNPSVNVGLSLSFPIQNNQIKSQLIIAQIELLQAKTNLSMIKSNLEIRWRFLCNDLKQKLGNRERFKKIFDTNNQRVNIDNRRFRLGRIKAFQWVKTEDDEAASFLRLQQSEIEVRQIAWEIEKLSGTMSEQIKNLINISTKVNHE